MNHGLDVPPNLLPGPQGAKAYVASAIAKFPDLGVALDDVIAEDDKVVVRNTWRATNPQSGQHLQFRGIVIWRIAHRQLVERWAYLESPHPE